MVYKNKKYLESFGLKWRWLGGTWQGWLAIPLQNLEENAAFKAAQEDRITTVLTRKKKIQTGCAGNLVMFTFLLDMKGSFTALDVPCYFISDFRQMLHNGQLSPNRPFCPPKDISL